MAKEDVTKSIAAIFHDYHLSLDREENASDAQDKALSSIGELFGMHREPGKLLADYVALNTVLEAGDSTDRDIVTKITSDNRIVTDEFPQGTFRRDGVRLIAKKSAIDADAIDASPRN